MAAILATVISCAPSEKVVTASPKPIAQPAVEPKKAELPKKVQFPRPEKVRGLYLNAWAAGSKKRLEKLLGIADRTEINAFVIDVRDDGEVYFPTGIKVIDSTQGKNFRAVVNPARLMTQLGQHGVYPIARIACFRDQIIPSVMTERAVQVGGGKIWKDRSGHTWLDPYNEKNWELILSIIDYAIDQGFPEIQLDYVRFPSEGKSSTQIFPAQKRYPDQKAKPEDVIATFSQKVADHVRSRGAVCSADIFGIISSGTVDQGIGQTLEKIAAPFDLVCPMVYPSHFAKGEYKIADPNRSPYAIIHKSLSDYKKRIPEKAIRPWLQDFTLDKSFPYGAKEVRAQIKAAEDLGYPEFLLWNAATRYTEGALKKEKAVSSTQGASSAASESSGTGNRQQSGQTKA